MSQGSYEARGVWKTQTKHWVHFKVKHYFIEKYVFEHPRLLMCNVVCKSFPFKRIRWRPGRDWAVVWLSTTDCSRGRENSMETIGLKNMATASKQSWTESQCIEKTAWRTSASRKIWNYFVYRSRQGGHPTRGVGGSFTGWNKKKKKNQVWAQWSILCGSSLKSKTLKGKFTQKLKSSHYILTPTLMENWEGVSKCTKHKTFPELHSKTAFSLTTEVDGDLF